MTAPRLHVAVAAASAGGVIGALGRYTIGELVPTSGTFPWTLFWINVLGCALLAALPAVPALHRVPWMAVFLGTGVLGGFTTMSASSTETVTLLEGHHTLDAIGYTGGTLLVALVAAWVIAQASTPAERADLELDEADE